MAKSLRKYEIWMTELEGGNNLVTGYRPCVVVSNDFSNTNPECGIATVIPLTSSSLKGGLPTHCAINPNPKRNRLKAPSIALAEQIRTVDKDLVKFCLGRLSYDEIQLLDKAILISLGFESYRGE